MSERNALATSAMYEVLAVRTVVDIHAASTIATEKIA